MKRTKSTNPLPGYDVQKEPIVMSFPLLDKIFKQPKENKPSDLLALYAFYYYTAKWQKTNQPKATTNYAANGLKWTTDRIRNTKKVLIKLGLIENVISRNEENTITGHYIKINFIWSQTHTNENQYHGNSTLRGKPECGASQSVGLGTPNALSSSNGNALSSSKQSLSDPTGTDDDIKKKTSSSNGNGSKPSIKKRNTKFLQTAIRLSDIIKQTKNMKHTHQQIKSWTNDLRLLNEGNGIDQDRMDKALDWYEKNIGGEYIPVIESGSSFREKFIKLEAAMKRNGNGKPKGPTSQSHIESTRAEPDKYADVPVRFYDPITKESYMTTQREIDEKKRRAKQNANM
jgi:hypothetical protein